MKKLLTILLSLSLLLALFACTSDKNSEGATTTLDTSSTQATTTTNTPASSIQKYVQPLVQPPLENDKYPTVSHITIYKDGGKRYDITARDEIASICDYYKGIDGEFSQTIDSEYSLPSNEHISREIRFFEGGYDEAHLLGKIGFTTEGRYGLYTGTEFDFYAPTESNFNDYTSHFDSVFSSQNGPYMDVYTR